MNKAQANNSLSQGDLDAVLQRASQVSKQPPGTNRSVSGAGRAFDTSFETLQAYQMLQVQRAFGKKFDLDNPYSRLHQAKSGASALIEGRSVVNFASYDYLGLNGHPEITEAVAEAAAEWGTSVSASRITAGERQAHRDLEQDLAALYQAEDAVVFVSGHATAISTIATLLGPRDLIIHDSLIHNCVVVGAQQAGATRRLFPHNDFDALEQLLETERHQYQRVMIASEGLFSMDGDGPDLARLVQLKQRHSCWLLIDDAHGLGVLGATGKGIFEHAAVSPKDIDIWLGTLSKSLVSCGGYVAGSSVLIDLLKAFAPGYVYSVGLPVPATVAARTALRIMLREPERVGRLQENGRYFLGAARRHGLDSGPSWGAGIVPLMIGDTLGTVALAQRLLARGYNAFPVLPPGVPEGTARLRFFLSCDHTKEDIDAAVVAIAEELERIDGAHATVRNAAE